MGGVVVKRTMVDKTNTALSIARQCRILSQPRSSFCYEGKGEGHHINTKRIRRLMRLMGLMPIYQKPNTSGPNKRHKTYPYLLGGLNITQANHVWCADITYIPMRKGFLYLVAIMD